MRIKQFIGDSVLNLIVSFIPLIVLQLLIYPIISKSVTKVEYGTMITVYSFLYLIGGTLGTELNKERLIKEKEYTQTKAKGDFNVILVINMVLVAVACTAMECYVYNGITGFHIITGICTCLFIMLNSYLQVAFRIELNYKKMAIAQLISVLGYFLGLGIFFFTKKWIFVFLGGGVVVFCYILKTTDLLKEPYKKTEFFRKTFFDNMYLIMAGLFSRIVLYGDKILLFPIGGGDMVAIYYIATLFGKIISMSFEPVNTVFLSYLAKMDKIRAKDFKLILVIATVLCIGGYIACVAISKPILFFLYPQWAEEASSLIWITTLGVCLCAMCDIINSFVLKECDIYWQSLINGASGIVFFISGIALLNLYGLIGYCVGVSVSYLIKLILIVSVYIKTGQKSTYNV